MIASPHSNNTYITRLWGWYIENNTCQNRYHTPYQPDTPISARGSSALGVILVDMYRYLNYIWIKAMHWLFNNKKCVVNTFRVRVWNKPIHQQYKSCFLRIIIDLKWSCFVKKNLYYVIWFRTISNKK